MSVIWVNVLAGAAASACTVPGCSSPCRAPRRSGQGELADCLAEGVLPWKRSHGPAGHILRIDL